MLGRRSGSGCCILFGQYFRQNSSSYVIDSLRGGTQFIPGDVRRFLRADESRGHAIETSERRMKRTPKTSAMSLRRAENAILGSFYLAEELSTYLKRIIVKVLV